MTEKEKANALRLAALEEGYDVRAGNKTISDMVAIARLQEAWEQQNTTPQPKTRNSPRRSKPALVK
jgi:hypothetical protein